MSKRVRVLTGFCALFSLIAGPASAQESAEEMLQSALYKQEIEGDLQGAIELFRTIAEQHTDDRAVAARALLQLGLAYETLGSPAAERAYRELLSRYPEQNDAVNQATERLAALSPDREGNADANASLAWRIAGEGSGGPPMYALRGGTFEYRVAPDGKRVAYALYGQLYMRDLATGNVTTLVFDEDYDRENYIESFVWSPDNRTIAFQSSTLRTIDTVTREVTVPEPTEALNLHRVLDWSSNYLLGHLTRPDGTVSVVRIAADTWEVVPLLGQEWPGTSAVLSPDGSHAAVVINEDESSHVDVLAADGSARYRIANAASPFWSPDGQTIIYDRDGLTWAVPTVDGAPQGPPRMVRLPAGMRVKQWTADGSLFLELATNSTGFFRVGVDPDSGEGTGEIELFRGVEGGGATWSPDMTHVAFTVDETVNGAVGVYSIPFGTTKRIPNPTGGASNLWWDAAGQHVLTVPYGDPRILAIDVDSGEVRPMFAPLDNGARFHTNSDGSLMVGYQGRRSERRLVVAPIGEREGRVLASGGPEGGLSSTVRPEFSPDDTRVLFGLASFDRDARQAVSGLWVVATDGSSLRKVAEVRSSDDGSRGLGFAAWSPNSRYIAYTDRLQLFVTDVENGRQHEIDVPEEWGGTMVTDWSPDGHWLAVGVALARLELWTIDEDSVAAEAPRASQP